MLFVVAEIYCDRDHRNSKINFINETFKVLNIKDFKVVRINIISDKRITLLGIKLFSHKYRSVYHFRKYF